MYCGGQNWGPLMASGSHSGGPNLEIFRGATVRLNVAHAIFFMSSVHIFSGGSAPKTLQDFITQEG